jgi:hypothetical protein
MGEETLLRLGSTVGFRTTTVQAWVHLNQQKMAPMLL